MIELYTPHVYRRIKKNRWISLERSGKENADKSKIGLYCIIRVTTIIVKIIIIR